MPKNKHEKEVRVYPSLTVWEELNKYAAKTNRSIRKAALQLIEEGLIRKGYNG